MMATTAVVLILCAASLILMGVNVQVFRSQTRRYRLLFEHLENEEAWGRSGRILMPLYILSTIVITGISLYLFIAQPHLL